MKLILDAGHSGMAFGHYMTAGKRSPFVPPGVYEGEFNRDVADIACRLIGQDKCIVMTPGPVNIPIKDRVLFANNLLRLEPDSFLISIHANAIGRGGRRWRKGRGFVVFCEENPTISTIELSRIAHKNMKKCLRDDTPSRGQKRANFGILRKFNGPSILKEFAFMTNEQDAILLADKEFRFKCAESIALTYVDFYDYLVGIELKRSK